MFLQSYYLPSLVFYAKEVMAVLSGIAKLHSDYQKYERMDVSWQAAFIWLSGFLTRIDRMVIQMQVFSMNAESGLLSNIHRVCGHELFRQVIIELLSFYGHAEDDHAGDKNYNHQ